MLAAKSISLLTFAYLLISATADAQLTFQKVASFGSPQKGALRFSGGREVEFSPNGKRMIVAFYGSSAQIFDLTKNKPINEAIRTSGDGEVGFVNDSIAYTADWTSVRLWDANSGQQVGKTIPHELREDTIIRPAISQRGNSIATRATMTSVQIWDTESRAPIAQPIQYSTEVYALRFSDDGTLLFVRTGETLYVIDSKTGDDVAGPVKSNWLFKHFSDQRRFVLTEQTGQDSIQLVVRSTEQKGWPEIHRSDLPGQLKRLIRLGDDNVLLQATENKYTPAMYIFSLKNPNDRVRVETDADRAFDVVVPANKRLWICTNIRDIRCQEFGKSKPIWTKSIPVSGYDQKLYAFDNEHFIIRNKQLDFGVYRISDGSEIWKQPGVKRFSRTGNRLALCNKNGVEVWFVKKAD